MSDSVAGSACAGGGRGVRRCKVRPVENAGRQPQPERRSRGSCDGGGLRARTACMVACAACSASLSTGSRVATSKNVVGLGPPSWRANLLGGGGSGSGGPSEPPPASAPPEEVRASSRCDRLGARANGAGKLSRRASGADGTPSSGRFSWPFPKAVTRGRLQTQIALPQPQLCAFRAIPELMVPVARARARAHEEFPADTYTTTSRVVWVAITAKG